MTALRLGEILRTLCRHDVEFIVVGGISAVLQGVPLNTFDLDIVHARDEGNVLRVLAALDEMEAVYRFQPERRLKPAASHLLSRGHQLLLTKYGPLDVLGEIGKNRSFPDLLPLTVEWKKAPDMTVRILGLETQILIKEEVGAPKDQAMLPLLRRTLQERNKSTKPT